MRLGIACDHTAIDLKQQIINHFSSFDWRDYGCDTTESTDYPDYAHKVCISLNQKEIDLGFLLCGTGIGMSITANRHKGVRAALCHDTFTAKMARNHNNANILVMGVRIIDADMAFKIIEEFLSASFEGGRHERRILKIDEIVCI